MDKDDDGGQDDTVGKARFPCLPSLIALQQMRNRMNTAKSGRRLMKWSALATGRELRKISKELCTIYDSFTEDVRNAFIIIARCRYFYPNINTMVIESYPAKACVTVGRSTKSIAGCRIATYAIEDNCPDSYPCLGIDKGGETVFEAKRQWHELLRRLIQIEQLRSNFISLDESHKNATKKQNVLGKVIIPRTQVTIRYILSELEEMEREEFFRLKKVLEVKYRHKRQKASADTCPECAKGGGAPTSAPKSPVPVPKPSPPPPSEQPPPPPTEQPPTTPPKQPPTLPPVEEACILCEGPMHIEGQQIKLTDEQRKQQSVGMAELKQTLGKVLDATEQYEKSGAAKDSIAQFKDKAEKLKQKLRVPPPVIPDNVDVEKLCDLCHAMYDEQQALLNCVVCGEPIVAKDSKLAAAKESKRNLQKQLETTLDVVRELEREGLQDDKLDEFKKTAAELKNKLKGPIVPKDADVNKLCDNCKERMQAENELASKASSKSKVSIKEPATAASSAPSTEQSSDMPLGVFETEEITEIIQVRNPDGTISEKRRILTVKRKPGASTSSPGTSSYSDKKNVGHAIVHHKRDLMDRLPRDAHSEYAITSLPMAETMVKQCISSNFSFYLQEVLEGVTELESALLTYQSSPTTAFEAEVIKNFVSSSCTPVGDLEEDDESKTTRESS